MKRSIKLFRFVAISLPTLLSCHFQNQNEPKLQHDTAVQEDKHVTNSNIVRGSLISASGEQLSYTFDNNSNTMKISFKNDTATLTGEKTASGIKYSNKRYSYTEWQGNSTFYKDGNKVFEYTKSK